jgi:hypothetical protein
MLTVQPMILDAFHVYRLESSEAHVKSDLRRFDATVSQASKNLWCKVQPRGRRCYRTALARVYGLIAVPIAREIDPIYVWRQRHMPEPLNQTKEIRCRTKPNAALSETPTGYHLGS